MNDIMVLVDKYLAGLTSLAEEREIAAYVAAGRSDYSRWPEELQIVAEMLDEINSIPSDRIPRRGIILRRWAVAAAVAAAVTGIWLLPANKGGESDATPSRQMLYVRYASSPCQPDTLAMPSRLPDSDPADPDVASPSQEKKARSHRRKRSGEMTSPTDGPTLLPTDNASTLLPMRDEMPFYVNSAADSELKALMLECDMMILENQYQAYQTELSIINI